MSRKFQQYQSGDEPIPGYRLLHFLGRGNFGEVWMASAPGNKKVALKIIALGGREGLQESRAIERIKDINHAHLVSIFAYWLIDSDGRILDDDAVAQLSLGSSAVKEPSPAPGGTVYPQPMPQRRPVELIVAMSLGAKNLADLLEEYRQQNQTAIPVDALLDFMEEAAKGLDYLNAPVHDLGKGPLSIIHGDIKPQNLLIVGNSLQICDFGLARGIDEIRKTCTAMGSIAYAAPELLEGHPHVRSDQYCLAVSYVELRTGDLPLFGETNILRIAELHRDGKLDLSGLGPGEAEVIRKATHPDPQQRWPSCREMVRELRAAVELDSAGKSPRTAVRQSDATSTRKAAGLDTTAGKKRPARGMPRFFVVAALALLIIIALGAAAAWWGQNLLSLKKEKLPEHVANQERPQEPLVEPRPLPVVEPKPPSVVEPKPPPVVEPAEPSRHVVEHTEKQAAAPLIAEALTRFMKGQFAEVAKRIVEWAAKGVRSVRESHGPPGALANPFGDGGEADRCYRLLRALRRGMEAISPAERNWSADAERQLRVDLAAAAIFKTTPDLATAREISSDWIDAPAKDRAINPADAEVRWYVAVRSRLPASSATPPGPDDQNLVKASTRLIHTLADRFRRDGKRLDAEATKAIYANFLQPVLERTGAILTHKRKTALRNDLGDFYLAVYDFVANQRGAAWPVVDPPAWIDALLTSAIELRTGPSSGKSAEPLAPVADTVLRRLYRDRAQGSLARGDSDLDRAVADAGRAGASELLADALGRRAPRDQTRELLVEDLDTAIEEGKKAKTAYGLASLAVAYVLRANFDNHPAYTREARDRDVNRAAANTKQAEKMAMPRQAGSPGAEADLGDYLYHLAAARAYEYLAWLLEKDPAANINLAIREFAKAAKTNPHAPQPLCGMGRCYYQAIADIFLPPDALKKRDGGSFGDAFQVMDECERTLRAALDRDPATAEAGHYLALLDRHRAAAYFGQYQDDANDKDSLAKAKQCSATADEQARVAWVLARKQGLHNWDVYAVQWVMFPLSDVRYDMDKEQRSQQRRAEVFSRLEVLEKTPPPPGRTQALQRAAARIRGRLAELEGNHAAALQIYSDALPQDLAAAQGEDSELLLARAVCRLRIATRGKSPTAENARPSKQEIEEAQQAAKDAAAAGRVAFFLKGRISALEQDLFAHAFLYFAATSPATRAAMYARGLDDVTNLGKLAPRRPQEYHWCAVWARVAWGQVEHCPPDRSERLKCFSSAVHWASRAVELCQRRKIRAELTASLLKPYTEAALKFADEQLGKSPPPNPPFRTDLEKKRQEWTRIAAGLR